MIKSLFLALLLVGAFSHQVVSSKKDCAAVWVDDGQGHTIKAELPPAEAKVLKQQMLDVLGIEEPPKHRHHHQKTSSSAPQFLKSIYDALDERGNAPNLDEEFRETVSNADTIITFVTKGVPVDVSDSSNRRLFFDFSKVPMDLELQKSQLRLYRSSHYVPFGSKERYLINIYIANKDKSLEELVATVPMPVEGWVSIDVTSAMLKWLLNPTLNFGFRLAVTHPGKKHELHLHKVGLSGSHDKDTQRPFLIGFFERLVSEDESGTVHSRHTRSIDLKSGYTKPYLTAAASPVLADSPAEGKQCQKRPLHVSFRDLGWEEWVIAPDGYDANFCDGRCKFPMLANMNATNHAIIQTLVKMKHAVIDGQELPPDASCAPKDLSTISVLYYDYSQNVVLKKYPKMIVKTCACL